MLTLKHLFLMRYSRPRWYGCLVICRWSLSSFFSFATERLSINYFATCKLISVNGQVTGGTLGLSTATVKLIASDGEEKIACSIGTGPVDAAYKAVDIIIGVILAFPWSVIIHVFFSINNVFCHLFWMWYSTEPCLANHAPSMYLTSLDFLGLPLFGSWSPFVTYFQFDYLCNHSYCCLYLAWSQ